MSERWKRIDGVVQAALARPSAERQSFVRSACGSDSALCDEVLSLLEQDTASESRLAFSGAVAGPVMIGRTIATYRIDERIGAGGMGVVYRARDLRLERDVAVKILPSAVASDPDALARLGREARLLAALNHPRIAAIHGLEETDQVRALVMELLDGENLAQRIARGPLSVPEACRLGAQIADGLAAAHDRGIVHRDLKPANVQITSGGNVKLLDFGIAKAVDGDVSGTTLATRDGAVIGTPAYMSPEQMRGEAVDRQTDVWAFGCVLFEMLTGRRAFGGRTRSDVTAAVLEHEPAWSALPASVPQQIRTLARRCLMKDRSQRLRDLGDVRIALEDQSGLPSPESVGLAPPAPARQAARFAWMAVAATVTAVAIAVPLWKRASPAPSPAMPSTTIKLSLPRGAAWMRSGPVGLRISRNGRRLAAVLRRDDVASVFVLDLDTGAWREVAGTNDSRLICFSPDASEVAFIRDNALMHVRIDGGAPAKICDRGDDIRGGDWADDGRIVLGINNGGLVIVPSTGGVPASITNPDPRSSEGDHRYPIWLPGSAGIVFTVQNADTFAAGIGVTAVGSATHRVVVRGGRSPAFVDGHLVYVNEADELRAVTFDPVALVAGSQSFALAERPGPGEHTSDAAFRTSTADLVYVPSSKELYHFEVVDGRRSRERLRLPPQAIDSFSVSPNGERVAFASANGLAIDIWLYDKTAGSIVQLTTDGNSRSPRWADNDRLLFQRRGSNPRILALTLDAAGRALAPAQPVGELGGIPLFVDGDDLVYRTASDNNSDVHRTSISGRGRIERLLERPRNQWGAVLSPDRKWLAYLSDELGEGFDLFIAPYAVPLRPRRVILGARAIRWSRESNDLFFVQNGTLFVTQVDATGSPGARTPVMDLRKESHGLNSLQYDTLPNGGLLLAVPEPVSEDAGSPFLVLNWTARLREAIARK